MIRWLTERSLPGTESATRIAIPYWPALLQLFGAMFLPIFFSVLFYLNLVAWHSARSEYTRIFNLRDSLFTS